MLGVLAILAAVAPLRAGPATDTVLLRGHPQLVRLYGPPTGDPVIVSSGDGGWLHLGPHVAETLASAGYFVVGFDVKAYLTCFTSRSGTLRPEDVPRDYERLVAYASRATGRQPLLVGVSEGAGLSVLAAGDPAIKSTVAGVIGLGLPDVNELGWRWRDALIYLTHRAPDEPAFSAAAVIDRVAPLPVAAIHSTQDEFVPMPEVQRVMDRAREPKRLWVVPASNHRFSGNTAEFDRRLLDAIAWIHHVR